MPQAIRFTTDISFGDTSLPVIPYSLKGAPAARARFLATTGTTVTTGVTSWASLDGGVSMTPIGGTAPTKSTLGGYTVVRFNGVDNQLQAGLAQARPHAFAAVYYLHALPATEGIIVGGRENTSADPALGDGGTLSVAGGNWQLNAGANGAYGAAAAGWHTAVVSFDATTTTGRIDGAEITRDIGQVPRKIITLGGHRGAYYTDVSVAELVAFDGALTATQRTDIEASMRAHYQI